ncbi:hypothetical protein GCM10010371_50460 [Streptomyces subrutilus]|uniref:Protein phosphatase n=1 Tax=Streptomyces subrutilus TaxID=36818 RepID=A0A5P2UMU9_9ACTN|nr:hypothetical protein [Streptomyces subrutilus]QEU79645.1 hypothetical protein CP968_16075 [Streptomyces subrutilus]GGZ84566.1 hypothetical protein GCM10010371_50460 [Streptomyces subrutilus]
MSNAPVDPANVPVFTGQLSVLDEKVKALSADGGALANAGSSVHTTFGGMSAYYQAPEAEQLFAVTKPVVDITLSFSGDMCTIAGALGTYAQEIRPLVKKLEELKADAAAFRSKVSHDEDWIEDGDLIEENLDRRNEIAEVWTRFQAAERTAHDKIVALVCGAPLKVNDGSNAEGMYGYDAEALKHAKSLPWGDAVEESVPAWQVWEHAWDFGKGLIVDGVWGTIKGLGTLVGFDGWDAAGQAWTGLGKLATGLVITATPAAAVFWAADDKDLPSWIRDSRTAMKETGKALLAWDQWGSNPSRAAGAVTFNVLTTVFTGGAGGAAAGAGKAGIAAKAISLAGKAGRAIDPMTYVFKGAGAGISKIGDVMAGLKGMGRVEVPRIDEGAFSLPEGAVELPDGTIQLPKDTPIPEGAVKVSDDTIRLPEGTAALPPGTVKLPFDGPATYADEAGNLYKEDGSLYQRADEARPEPSPKPEAGAHTPGTQAPVRREVPVLAGVGARGGDDVIRLGSDAQAPVHTVDNAAHNGAHGVDHTPTGRAGDPATPGGHAPEGTPRNDLNQPPRGGHGDSPATPATHGTDSQGPGGSRPDGPGSGGGHPDGPGSGGAHNPLGGHGPGGFDGIPGLDDIPGLGDDAARAGDGTNPAGGHDGQPAHPTPGSQLTPEQVKAKQDGFVQRANDPDKTWFNQYYRSDGHRLSVQTKIDDVELPILAKDGDGSWISKNSLPSATSETRFGRAELGRSETLPKIDDLDDVARDRKASVDLANAERLHKASPTAETLERLADAQKRFDERITPRWGENTSNNTSFSERLGEDAARLHVVPERFPGAVEQVLPKTPNGANMFDQMYRTPDGKLVIIEAKAPSSGLMWRKGVGPAKGFMVKQGTEPYLRTIIAEMQLRPTLHVTDAGGRVWTNAELALELKTALDGGNLEYAMVKAKDGGAQYAGAVLEHFKI